MQKKKKTRRIRVKYSKEYYEKFALLWWQSLSKEQQADFLVKRIRNSKAFKDFMHEEQVKDITPLFIVQKNGNFKYNKKAVKMAS